MKIILKFLIEKIMQNILVAGRMAVQQGCGVERWLNSFYGYITE
jgi:hypothetical protein